jgi:hypothetical protein
MVIGNAEGVKALCAPSGPVLRVFAKQRNTAMI